MAKEGYQTITIKDDLLHKIDALVDFDDSERKSRQKVIALGIMKLHSKKL